MCKYLRPVIGLVVATVLAGFRPGNAPAADRTVYLEWMRDPTTTMVVNWLDLAGHNSLEYRLEGTAGAWTPMQAGSQSIPHSSNHVHSVELTGLAPDTRYEFRFLDAPAATHTFSTMPAALGDEIKIMFAGDSRGFGSWFYDLNKIIGQVGPHFVVGKGDYVACEGMLSSTNTGRWEHFLGEISNDFVDASGRKIPFVPAIGNHEANTGWDGAGGQPARYMDLLFNFPYRDDPPTMNQGYGVLPFGDYLQLLFLDSYHTNDIGPEQTAWLESVIDGDAFTHVIPTYHSAVYPSNKSFDRAHQVEMRRDWVPLFQEHGVQIVMEACDHTWKKSVPIRVDADNPDGYYHPDGMVFLGDGGWGAPLRTVDVGRWWIDDAAGTNRNVENARHVFLVTLRPHEVQVDSINSLGVTFDSFIMTTAESIVLTGNDPSGSTSFNTGLNWSDGQAPSADKLYYTGTHTLRTPPSGAAAFAGDSLTIESGGTFLFKTPGPVTVDNLRLAGGQITHGQVGGDEVATLAGGITLLGGISRFQSDSGRTINVESAIDGAGNIEIYGRPDRDPGVVIFNAENTYGGTTAVTGSGTLRLAHGLAMQNSTLTTGGVEFDQSVAGNAFTLGGLSGSGSIVLENTAGQPIELSVGQNNQGTTFSGTLSGDGGLRKVGTGRLTLSSNNTYAGLTIIDEGTVRLGHDSALGSTAAGTVVNPNGTLDLRGRRIAGEAVTVAGTLTNTGGSDSRIDHLTLSGNAIFTGTRRWDIHTGQFELAGFTATKTGGARLGIVDTVVTDSSGGDGGLLLSAGTDELVLARVHWTTGTLTVESGVVVDFVNNNAPHTYEMDIVLHDGATINVRGAHTTVASPIAVAGSTTIEVENNSLTATGPISGTGLLAKRGGGTLGIEAPMDAFTGEFLLAGGTLEFGGNDDISLSGLFRTSGSRRVNNHLAAGNTLTLADVEIRTTSSQTFRIDGSGDTVIAGSIFNSAGGTSSLRKTGSGTLTLSGDIDYTGTTAIEGGTLRIDRSGEVSLGGATSGSGTVIQTGGHLLMLANTSNSFTGDWYVRDDSTLQVTTQSRLPRHVRLDGGHLIMTTTGETQLHSDRRIHVEDGGGSINVVNAGGTVRVDNATNQLRGSGELTKLGPGTLQVGNSSGFTGTWVLEEGLVRNSRPETMGNNATVVFNGGNLHYTSGSDRDVPSGHRMVVAAGGGQMTMANRITVRNNDIVSGTGTLALAGPDTLRIENPQPNFTGTWELRSGGTLQVLHESDRIGGPGAAVLFDGGTLRLSNSSMTLDPSHSFTVAGGGGTFHTTSHTLTLGTSDQLRGSGMLQLTGSTGAGTLRIEQPQPNFTGELFLHDMILEFGGDDDIALTGLLRTGGSRQINNQMAAGSTLTLSDVEIRTTSDQTLRIDGAGDTAITGSIFNSAGGTSSLRKTGSGELTLAGGTSSFGALSVDGGLVTLSDGADVSLSGSLRIGDTGQGVLRIESGTALAHTGSGFLIGRQAGSHGTVVQDGGQVAVGTYLDIGVDHRDTFGRYEIHKGSLDLYDTSDGRIQIGREGEGRFVQTGGAVTTARVTTSRAFTVGTVGQSVGTYEMSGGELHVPSGRATIGFRDNSQGTFVQSNDATVKLGRRLTLGEEGAAHGQWDLQGGQLYATEIVTGSGTGQFNWSGGTLRPYGSGGLNVAMGLTLTGAGAFFDSTDLDDTPSTITVNSPIGQQGGAWGVTKQGQGTLTLHAANTYTGPTHVAAGTLKLGPSGSLSSSLIAVAEGARLDVADVTGGFSVADGQTLAGSGTVWGDTTLGDEGFLAPGDSGIGKLSFTDNLTLDAGATLLWQFINNDAAGDDYDTITGTDLILPESGQINLTILGLDDEPGYRLRAGDSFTLFDGDVHHGSTLLDFGEDITHLFNINDAHVDWWGTWEVTAGSLMLTAVPEPGTLLMAMAALALLLGRRRRS